MLGKILNVTILVTWDLIHNTNSNSILVSINKMRNREHAEAQSIHFTLIFQITKAALVITVIFIVTFSYNLWYFLLGTIGLFEFRTFTFHQAFSQWGTSFNCFINPFVYIIVMPSFVRSVKKTFCCYGKHNRKASGSARLSKSELSLSTMATSAP